MIGTQVGKYRIESELGRGGMGVVYQGLHTTLERRVAIKMLPAHLADADTRARFRREALTLARLAHPNIVSIFDVEDLDGHSFIVMEHAGGGSLGDQMVSGTRISPTRATEIMAPVLSALQAAHLAGVVHRDIKPDNILFTDTGRPKLTDFGVAHMRDGGSRTRTGVMLGTPYYMAPEQAQGRPVTAAADIYAVGVVLFEMLSGRVPFTGQDPVSVALKHVQETPPSLFELRPDLPADLCALVHRAIEKDPAARFTSAAAMQDALQAGPWSPAGTLDPASSGSRPSASPSQGALGVVAPPPLREATRPLSSPGASAGASPGASAGASPGASAADPAATATPASASTAYDPAATSHGGAPHEPGTSSGAGARSGSDAPRSSLPSVDLDRAAEVARAGLASMGATSSRALTWLQRPGPRGLPMAFWAGATALAIALGWIGADAMTSPSSPPGGSDPAAAATGAIPDSRSGADRDPSSATRTTDDVGSRGGSSAGGGSSIGTRRLGDRSALGAGGSDAGPALSPEDVAALTRMATGRDDDEPADSSSTPGSVVDDLTVADDRSVLDDVDEPSDDVDDIKGDDEDASVTRTGPPSASASRREIQAIVERQLEAVASENRAGFLQDFHPTMRSEAAREFDDANAGVRNFRSTTSNLEIEFLDPTFALVTFDVDFSFVVRADGRTIQDSESESWELVWEDNRWWILEWD